MKETMSGIKNGSAEIKWSGATKAQSLLVGEGEEVPGQEHHACSAMGIRSLKGLRQSS